LFEGFEEDGKSISIDILSPKTSVKRLALKSIRINSPSHRHSFTFSNSSSRLRSTLHGSLNESSGDQDSPRLQGTDSNDEESNSTSSKNKSFEEAVPLSVLASPESSTFASAPEPDRGARGVEQRFGCGVSLTRGGYYIQPSVEELDNKVDDRGNCLVNNLVIGRQNHGEIRFLQPVNVAGLDIDEIGS
jgi:hypothetical protein